MSEITIDNISELWNYLGSVWGNLGVDDKEFIETLWKAYAAVITSLGGTLDIIRDNRSIRDISPVITETDNYYDIIYGTSDDDEYGTLINTFTTASGLIGYQLDGMILSVSGVVNYYYVDEDNPREAQELVENVDFIISGLNSIIFLNDPPFTPSVDYPTLSRSTIYIEKLDKINPNLFRVWGKQLAITSDIFTNAAYTCWSQYTDTDSLAYKEDLSTHYKYIIDGLRYWSLQVPTLKVVKCGTGIAYGLPFAYNSGLLTHNLADDGRFYAEIGDQQLWFTTSGEMSYIIEGQYDRFDLLVDSYNIYDYTSNSVLVEQHMDDSGADKYNILIAETSSGLVNDFPFTYDDDVYDEWLLRTIPKKMKFIEIS